MLCSCYYFYLIFISKDLMEKFSLPCQGNKSFPNLPGSSSGSRAPDLESRSRSTLKGNYSWDGPRL